MPSRGGGDFARDIEHPCEMAATVLDSHADGRRPLAHPLGGPRGRRRPRRRGHPAAADARRIHRPARGQGEPVGAADGGAGQGRGGRPRPPVRPARPRQDDPRDDHRPRARRQRPLHVGPGDRAGRRPRRDPDLARGARRPVHRRDPPPQPGGRGDPLSGDGGLRARRDDRQGPVAPGRCGSASSRSPWSAPRPGRAASARPLRDRFGATYRLDFYTDDELAAIVERSAAILGRRHRADAAVRAIARRGRGTPRIVNRLLKRVRDHAQVHGDGRVDEATATAAMRAMEIDDEGLDSTDRKLLAAIVQKFASGPVGVAALAAVLSEEVETIEDVYEPFLLRLGFIDRTPQGRIATEPRARAPVGPRLRDPAAAPAGARDAPACGTCRRRRPAETPDGVDRARCVGAAPPVTRSTSPPPADGSTRARAGRLTLTHGVVETPQFMPVGTNATVKALDRRTTSATSAPRSSSPTPTTSTCGPATSASSGSAACTGSWTGTARS